MKNLRAYLKQRRKGLIAFTAAVLIFAFSFYLYHLPLKAVLYPTLLCAGAGLLALLYDYYQSLKKHRKLLRISELPAEMITDLPDVEGLDDHDYQKIIDHLKKESGAYRQKAHEKYLDLTEYYTLWVHQIKTPLTSMRLSLEKEDSPLSRKLNSDLFQIEQYVEMVLAYLRLEGVNDFVFKEYDLDQIIQESLGKFAGEFILRKIKLEYEATKMKVITDEKWLAFVIEQLLSNALKYTKEGAIKIYAEDEKILCIQDSGIGIAKEDLPRVFEKGYTGLNGRLDKCSSGIGLYLCKKVTDQLGIKLTIESKLNAGTTVILDMHQYELKGE